MRRLILQLLLFLPFLFGVGAAYWYCAHCLTVPEFAVLFVTGQLLRVALFSQGSS